MQQLKALFAALMEWAALKKNWIRIWFKKRFTDQVKVIRVKDPTTGEEVEATVEQSYENVCPHRSLKQIDGSFWKCADCEDAWFDISYKVFITPEQLEVALTNVAKELGVSINYEEPHED